MKTVEDLTEISFSRVLSPELESFQHLAENAEDLTKGHGFLLRVGNRPIAVPLHDVYQRLKLTLNPIQERTSRGFSLWLVPHRIAIHRDSGFAEAVAVGLEVEYLLGDRTCSVIGVIPGFAQKKHGNASLGIRTNGRAGFSGVQPTDGNDVADDLLSGVDLGGGLRLGAHVDGDLSFQWSADVSTPIISASGEGSDRCQWRIEKDRTALFGRSITFWSLVCVSKRQRELPHRVRSYAVLRSLLIPFRIETPWVQLDCSLTST
jgi:hypothetical protein